MAGNKMAFGLISMCACIITSSRAATLTGSVPSTKVTVGFEYTLSADKTDIEYVPIGSAPTVNAIETSIQFSGWGTQHGLKIRLVSDWFNQNNQADRKVTAYIEDSKPVKGFDSSTHIDVIYKMINNNIFYYLKIDSRYIGCIQGNCLQLTNGVKQYVTSDAGYTSGGLPGGIDANFDASGYSKASEVFLAESGSSTVATTLSKDKTDVEFIALGSAPQRHATGFDIAISGPNTEHSFRVDAVADYYGERNGVATGNATTSGLHKATFYVTDNAAINRGYTGGGVLRQHVTFHYYKYNQRMFYYMRIPGDYFRCGANKICVNAAHTVYVTGNGRYFAASDEGGADPNFAANMKANRYFTGTLVMLSDLVALGKPYTVALSESKTDKDYIPLGRGISSEPLSVDVGIKGWGTEHNFKLDIVMDYVGPKEPGLAKRGTVYFKENLHDEVSRPTHNGNLDHLEVLYKRDAIDSGVIFYYLAIDPKYIGCDTNELCKDEYEHFVTVLATGGIQYVPGEQEPGRDATFAAGKGYAKATKVDLGAVPQLTADVASLQQQLVDQNNTFSAQLAAQKQAMDELKATVDAFMGPLATDTKMPPRCKYPDCTPSIEADGKDVTIAATGGKVMFQGAACEAQDLCQLAKDVAAVKSKFQV